MEDENTISVACTDDGRKNEIIAGIVSLESKQARAVRECLLGIDGAVDRLRDIDEQIAALREMLT